MKNFTMVFSWPPDLWIDICPACLEKRIPGTQVLKAGGIIMDPAARSKSNITEIRQSPCKCQYCGASGEKGDR